MRSSKIAPFRMYSRGYTGQVKVPLRRYPFSLEQLAKNKARAEEVIATNFAALETAFEVTQYLRGRLYTFVDLVMANEYKDPDKEIPPVIEFLKTVLRLIVLWLNSFPKWLKSFAEYQMYPKLFLVDRNVALAACGYEMIDMLRWLFCLHHRTLVFFVRYDVEPEAETGKKYTKPFEPGFVAKRDKDPVIPVLMEKLKNGDEMVFGLFINLFNAFCEWGGLQAVLDIIVEDRLVAKAGEGFIGYKLPLEAIAMVLSPFKGIKPIAAPDVVKELVEAGKTTFLQRIQSLDAKDIKDINRESIVSCMDSVRDLLKLSYSEEEASKIVETHEMLLSLKFIQSPYLEKRLQGIADIRRMIERVDPPPSNQRFIVSVVPYAPHQSKAPQWFTGEYLAKWILNNKILDVIYGENIHPELIKRTASIIIFLAKKDMVTNELVEMLWGCQQDKHEDIIRVVYDTIKEILGFLNPDQIGLLYHKIKAIPLEACDEKIITFMKDFTLKAFTVHAFYQKMKSEPVVPEMAEPVTFTGEVTEPADAELYFVPTFWKLIQDETGISAAMTDLAITAMKECIREPHCSKYYPQYFNLCIQNLLTHRSVKQSLALAPYILGSYNAKKSLGPRLLCKNYLGKDLVTIILDDCEFYENVVRSKLPAKEDLTDKVFLGKYGHLANLEARFKFLEQVLGIGPEDLKMGKENVMRVWRLFVENVPTEYDSKVFLKWVSAEKETTTGTHPVIIFKPEENVFLFEIVAAARAKLGEVFGLLYYKCFAKHFKLINLQNHSLITAKSKILIKDYEHLLGLDPLWENATFTTDEGTRVKFCELLVDVYLNQSDAAVTQKPAVVSQFIDRCMVEIMKAHPEPVVANLVRLLLLFIETLDGAKYAGETEPTPTGAKFPITIILKPATVPKKIEVPLNITVGQLRRRVADALGLPFAGFQMSTKTRLVCPEDDDTPYREFGWSDQITVTRSVALENYNFKAVLSQNQVYINHLFVLLAKETAGYVDPVWDLLMMLPPNQKMKSDIETLNLPEGKPEAWDALLDSTSVHKLLYALQIVDKIIASPAGDSKDTQAVDQRLKWIDQFSKKGGLTHLFYALLKLPLESLHHPLTRKCFALLIRLLAVFQAENKDFEHDIVEYEKSRGAMIERVLTILEAFAHYSILPPGEKEEKQPHKEKPQQIYKTKEESSAAGKAAMAREETKVESQALVKKRNKQIEESRTFDFGFKLIKARGAKKFFEPVAHFSKLKDLLLKGLILTDNRYMQYQFGQELQNICAIFKDAPYSDTHPHVVLIPLMLTELVKETLPPDTKCMPFYKLLCTLIDGIPRKHLETLPVNFHTVLLDAVELVKSHEVRENTSTDTDYSLVGLLNLIESVLKKFPTQKALVGGECGMVAELLRCLFEYPSMGSNKRGIKGAPPKCKSQAARIAAFNLLCVLARDTPGNLSQIIHHVLPIHVYFEPFSTYHQIKHRNGSWRTKRIADWCIAPETTEKSTTGYVGLKNLGCTCYMNSLIQQLYMIPTFRNDLLAVEDPDKVTPPEENLLFQTQCLFAALNQSVKQYYNPKLFCNAFKDLDKKPINVLEQMDVDEFFNLFMDRLEMAMKVTPQMKTIQYHFGGLFANQFIGKECPHSSTREEPFLALNLQVKNKRSLQQCLESFVEGEMMQGSDAYYCEKCDKKVATLKRVCIKKLPRYLICVLKRFEFNYDTMQKFKVNDYCEFPTRLNMEAFTEEGLARKDKEKEREKAKREGRDLEEESNGGPKVSFPPEYYEYKLTGVVIHIGTAEAGHYYSLIMDREKDWLAENERWYEFNDALVNQYDLNDLKDDAFGGDERSSSGYESMVTNSLRGGGEKIRNAYLLVYERIKAYDPPEEDEDDEKAVPKKVGQKGDPTISEGIRKAVLAENVKYWHNKFMFNEDYFDFAQKLCMKWNSAENLVEKYPSKNMDYSLVGVTEEVAKKHAFQTVIKPIQIPPEEAQKIPLPTDEVKQVELLVFQYATTFLLTTLFRSRQRVMLPEFMDLIKAFINKHIEAARWTIWQFTNHKTVAEFFIENGDAEISRFVAGILYCAALQLYQAEKERIKSVPTESVLTNFANCMLAQLAEAKKRAGNVEFFFQILSRLTFVGPEMREYLVKVGGIRRLVGYWKSIPESGWNVVADIPFKENVAPELGLPSEVDERFRSPFEEYFNLRKEQLYPPAIPLNTFLFDAIGGLLKAVTPGTADVDPIGKALVLTPKLIQAFVKEAKSSIAQQGLSKGLSSVATQSSEFAKPVIKGICMGIHDVDWDEIKKHFYMLREVLRTPAKDPEKAVDFALSELCETLKSQQKAFYATIFAMDYLVALAAEIPAVKSWYQTHLPAWDWVFDWLKNNQTPSLTNPMSAVKPYKSKEQNESVLSQYAYNNAEQIQNSWRAKTDENLKQLTLLKDGIPDFFADSA